MMESSGPCSFFHQGDARLPCVVFVNGDIHNHTCFRSLVDYVQQKGHSTLCFDFPGHGACPYQPIQDYVALLSHLIETYDLVRPIFVGHSSGGIIATEYAVRTENASSVILINSCFVNPCILSTLILNHTEAYFAKSRELFVKQQLVDLSTSSITSEVIRRLGFESTDPRSVQELVTFYTSLPLNERLFTLDIPFLLLSSPHEAFIPIDRLRELVARMKQTRLVSIEGDHEVLITHPQTIISLLEEHASFVSIGRRDRQ